MKKNIPSLYNLSSKFIVLELVENEERYNWTEQKVLGGLGLVQYEVKLPDILANLPDTIKLKLWSDINLLYKVTIKK